MGDFKKEYLELWYYAVGMYDSQDVNGRYRYMKDKAREQMKPGMPLAHLSKEQVTWEQVEEAMAQPKRARDGASSSAGTGAGEGSAGMAHGPAAAAAATCNAAQGPNDHDNLTGQDQPAEQGAAGTNRHTQQIIIDSDEDEDSSEEEEEEEEEEQERLPAAEHQQKKPRLSSPVMTGGGTVITPEELDMLTRDPETLRNKPLYRWQPQQLDRLSSAINAKEKELSTERTSLSKASWTFTQQVAKFSFTAGKGLSDAEQGLVAELEPDEVGKRFLAVAQPRLQQARAEVVALADELSNSPEQAARDQEVMRLRQEVSKMKKCAEIVKEAIENQHAEGVADRSPASLFTGAPQREPPTEAPEAHIKEENEASQATAVTDATNTSNGRKRSLLSGLFGW